MLFIFFCDKIVLYDKKVIHRDIKPNNIFLIEKENDSENNDNNSNLETNQNRINTISYEYKKPKIKNNYSRLRTYQPIISENWKYRNGLRLSLGTDKINSSPVQNDIEYQYKIINNTCKVKRNK